MTPELVNEANPAAAPVLAATPLALPEGAAAAAVPVDPATTVVIDPVYDGGAAEDEAPPETGTTACPGVTF